MVHLRRRIKRPDPAPAGGARLYFEERMAVIPARDIGRDDLETLTGLMMR